MHTGMGEPASPRHRRHPRADLSPLRVARTNPFPEWEIDQRVPLELGGSNATTNLSPKHHPQAKDRLENRLHDRVCAHQMTLAHAQAIFKGDWRRDE
jgi:hypothetical protein